ncbi:E3 ubiquitin-protein ligase rnf168 isoform 1-T3 [Pholidichthys leucotaenia]
MAPVLEVELEMPSVSDGTRERKENKEKEGGRKAEELSRENCLCPICLEIFLEPVTLPCSHSFCKDCFLESVHKATLCCPICRKRVSTWVRLNTRKKTLVNQQLWEQIQSCFPQQCQHRRNGLDTSGDNLSASPFFPRVSEPGELKQEFDEQINKMTEEKRMLDEEQRRASEEYIRRLMDEEAEEKRRREEEDEQVARLLSDQLNASSESKEPSSLIAKDTPAKTKNGFMGQIEKFLCPRTVSTGSSCTQSSNLVSNKENIFLSGQAQQPELSPPKLDYYGLQTTIHPASEEEKERQLQLIRPLSAKRKSSELDTEEKTESLWCDFDLISMPEYAKREEELRCRQQQEEEDWRLALQLQKELNKEEKKAATDRRKGSVDAYLLRQDQREQSWPTFGRASRNTSSTSSTSRPSAAPTKSAKKFKLPSSSSTSSTSKQTTLTEMFFSLNS